MPHTGRTTGDARIDAILADPAIRYHIDAQIRYGQTRALEFVLATVMVAFGVVLLLPGSTFSSHAYSVVALFVSEWTAGWLGLSVGIIRFAALTRNGRGQRTPVPRAIGCLAGCAFWTALTIGFAATIPPLSTGLAVYPVLALAELYSAKRAAGDLFVLDSLGLQARERQRELHRFAAAG